VGGCAWRSGNTEHYWGPVLFRYIAPPTGKAYVSEQAHFLLSFEGGRQWGISLGWKTRVAVAAKRTGGKPADGQSSPNWEWSKPLSLFGGVREGGWNLSLLYLRGEHIPSPELVSRSVLGSELGIGAEANTFSVGLSNTTEVHPTDNAFHVLRYDGHRPMETLFQISRFKEGEFPPMLIEEETP